MIEDCKVESNGGVTISKKGSEYLVGWILIVHPLTKVKLCI